MKGICLDAGVMGIHFTKDSTKKVISLMNSILKDNIKAFVLKPILVETYYHLCKIKGVEIAKISLSSFIRKYPIELVDITQDLIFSAGKLKCQNRKTLSYNDAITIAFCLNNRIEFHTTEKNLKKIPNNTLNRLKIKKYRF